MANDPMAVVAGQCANVATSVEIMLRDELDQQIVASLVANGRATYAEIGEAVGLSAPATKRRVDRLVDEGVITGFTALVGPGAVGATMEAFVELHCRGRTSPASLRDIVAALPAVRAAYSVTGEADALVHLACAGVDELERTVEHIRADERVVRTSTIIVLSRLLERRA
jgi:DNA-binding Lrp family transcriptional regulator